MPHGEVARGKNPSLAWRLFLMAALPFQGRLPGSSEGGEQRGCILLGAAAGSEGRSAQPRPAPLLADVKAPRGRCGVGNGARGGCPVALRPPGPPENRRPGRRAS